MYQLQLQLYMCVIEPRSGKLAQDVFPMVHTLTIVENVSKTLIHTQHV